MKIKISDMLDHLDGELIETEEMEAASLNRIKEKTMDKIHKEEKKNHSWLGLTRKGLVAAGLAAALCVSAAAYVVVNWEGFARTDDLTDREITQLLEQAETGELELVETDGTVHYYDQDGKEVLVLTSEEAAEYEQNRQKEHHQAVTDSTQLVDVTSMEFIPNSITELAANADGSFPDFALGNGHAVLLHPQGANGYQLSAGDVVTLTMKTDEPCCLSVGQFKDGVFIEEHTVNGEVLQDTLTIQEDGLYVFSLIYASVTAGNFTDSSLTIN